jgi:hypothetical protein
MSKSLKERIASIVRQRKAGKNYKEIAMQFGMTQVRARQIFETHRRDQRQRAELVEKYGARPRIASLPDSTPLEVLKLCDGRIKGWSARLSSVANAREFAIKTLGDLRNMTDAEVRRTPNVGNKMVAELRWFCPSRDPEQRRNIASARAARAQILNHMRRALRAIDELESDSGNAGGAPVGSSFPSLKQVREELERALALAERMRRQGR